MGYLTDNVTFSPLHAATQTLTTSFTMTVRHTQEVFSAKAFAFNLQITDRIS